MSFQLNTTCLFDICLASNKMFIINEILSLLCAVYDGGEEGHWDCY